MNPNAHLDAISAARTSGAVKDRSPQRPQNEARRRGPRGRHLALGLWLVAAPATLVASGLEGAVTDAPATPPISQSLSGPGPEPNPNRYGPVRSDPAAGVPRHAYSPFDNIDNPPPYQPAAGRDFLPGRLVVKLKSTAAGRTAAVKAVPDVSALQQRFAAYGITGLERVFPNAQPAARQAKMTLPGTTRPEPDLTRWLRAACAEDQDVRALAKQLAADPDVEAAEPDFVRRLATPNPPPLPDGSTDPLYAQQWHLAAAKVPEAWAYLQSLSLPPGGSHDVIVAVIDTGVDYNHPDLAANVWTNSREIAGNSRDDDGNGFVDDVHGCTTVSTTGSHSGNPMDDHGHGTHVAGIIAAQAINAQGGVGVAYNVQIMAIKAAQYSGVLAASDVAEAIQYAVQQGADVINMSFGGYTQSQVEQDALVVAFGQCVLVAAAGNDGVPNEPCDSLIRPKPMYPASYNWVLGVMARTQDPDAKGNYLAGFSNFDGVPNTAIEYELMAPGADIWSTLPSAQYAAWDGTSMATPIVSGIAALARTRWTDKDLYSSRFIMGQIATTGPSLQGRSDNDGKPVAFYHTADAMAALTTVPKPQLSYLQHWLFDTTQQAEGNDDDGILDAGETADLAIVIRNQWGKADAVTATLEAWASGATQADPYVTWLANTVDYGAIGSFNWDDNGLIYDAQGAITGVRHPFRFQVSPDCPNDHLIPFRLTMSCRNGLDPADRATYTTQSRFNLMVQRGRELPRIISQDMTLTKDSLWLVPDQTLIESNAVVRVEPGTQVEFWSLDPKSPYASQAKAYLQVEGLFLAQGTPEDPVEFFPNPLVPDGGVEIVPWHGGLGRFEFTYTRIQSPMCLRADGTHRFDVIDHCYFASSAPRVRGGYRVFPLVPMAGGGRVYRSIYHALGLSCSSGCDLYSGLEISSPSWESLYDGCALILQGDPSLPGLVQVHNTYLRNYRLQQGVPGHSSLAQIGALWRASTPVRAVFPTNWQGHAYFALSRRFSLETAEAIAQSLGGHLAAVNDASENAFLASYRQQCFTWTAFAATYPADTAAWDQFSGDFVLGLAYREDLGTWRWTSAEETTYTNWQGGEPNEVTVQSSDPLAVELSSDGSWYDTRNRWGPWIAEIPAPADPVALDSVLQACHDSGAYNTVFHDNAILIEWWNPDRTFWPLVDVLTFPNGQFPRGDRLAITRNYWATSSTRLMDQLLHDGNDDFNLGRFIYEPMLSEPPAACYPFVVNVRLSTDSGDTTIVGLEPVTFTVTFNRDMDPNIPPQVSFGPDTPLTDYTVHPVGGGWQDARTWAGTFNITPTTGDGYQLIRVAGAVAADDPWLVTGDDGGRFRFEIITSGTESMNLQASGGEGKVDLSWMQDDFDLLAGYNLYRSANSTNSFARLNASIIPPLQKTYRDQQVQPGQRYYYKFTVVKTDMSESAFSNTDSATPLDTVPPVITHTPVTSALPGMPLTLFADVTDNVGVQAVTLYSRTTGAAHYTRRAMTWTASNRYAATVEGSSVAAPGLEYYLEATDGITTVRSGRPEYPWPVTVVDRPVITVVTPNHGPASGGTSVTIAGSNFRTHATVSFGGVAAQNVTVVNANQMTCATGSHFPAAVDVVVTNPSGQSGTLLRGYTYESEVVSLSLPSTGGPQHAVVQVPINAANVQGLAAVSVTVTFDSDVLHGRGAQTGSLTPGWTVVANSNTVGQVRLSMASPGGTVTGDGVLAYVELEVLGAPATSCALGLAGVSLNNGAIATTTAGGSFLVNRAFDVSGTIRHWASNAPVSGVTLTLAGDRTYNGLSGSTGAYVVAGAEAGAYTLMPVKSDGVKGVTAYDASLALQHDARLITLNGNAATAADVDRDGQITAMDAFYILQTAVGLITPPFPGAGVVWDFSPRTRSFMALSANQTGQDFTAILLGEVSGNWSASGVGPSTAKAGQPASRAVTVALRAVSVRTNESRLWLLVDATEPRIYSVDATLEYEAASAAITGSQAGLLAAGLTVAVNTNQPGVVRLGFAGAVPVQGVGGLLALSLHETADAGFHLTGLSINEGAVPVEVDPAGATFDGDTDGDGQSDWFEVRAGTDPQDRASVFALGGITVGSDLSRTVTWSSVPGHVYRLLYQDAVAGAPWVTIGEDVLATGESTSQTDHASAGRTGFYRVGLVE